MLGLLPKIYKESESKLSLRLCCTFTNLLLKMFRWTVSWQTVNKIAFIASVEMMQSLYALGEAESAGWHLSMFSSSRTNETILNWPASPVTTITQPSPRSETWDRFDIQVLVLPLREVEHMAWHNLEFIGSWACVRHLQIHLIFSQIQILIYSGVVEFLVRVDCFNV